MVSAKRKLWKESQQKAVMAGIPFAENVTRLWQLLSVTLQRSNAFAIKRRLSEQMPQGEEPLPSP